MTTEVFGWKFLRNVFVATVAAPALLWMGASESKDLGLYSGQPTPALAMYRAQVNVAVDKCVQSALIPNVKAAESFKKYFNNGVLLRQYNTKDQDFSNHFAAYTNSYELAWNGADEVSRQHFCNGLQADIAEKAKGFFHWAAIIGYYRGKFSPITEATKERAEKITGALSLAAVVASNAASISAGRDAIAASKSGDFSTFESQMALSRGFHSAGAGFVDLGAIAQSSPEPPLVAVMDRATPEDEKGVIRCPVIDHFMQYRATADAAIWITYQKVSTSCRDALPGDFEHLH
jgi:hypothetical protein